MQGNVVFVNMISQNVSPQHSCFFLKFQIFLKVYIFGICRWAPINMDFTTHGIRKFQIFNIIEWTFVNFCFFEKVSHLRVRTPY